MIKHLHIKYLESRPKKNKFYDAKPVAEK